MGLIESGLYTAESFEKQISDILLKLGIPANLSGYKYDKTAIALAAEDEGYLDALTKALYPTVAKKHKTTWSKVERGIRYTIVTMKINKSNFAEQIFGKLDRKLVNGEFIATIAEYVRLNKKEE